MKGMESGYRLNLFETVDRDDEDGGAFSVFGGGGTGLVQDLDGGFNLFGFKTYQQGGHAAAQKAAGGGDARDAEIGGGKPPGDGVRIGVTDYSKDEFHG
jgi:hypothetical protein